jgi:DNA-binding transcriptional LysR family regulator
MMVPMDLRQLAALTAVADCGTFSAAAERLHTVQSNVSAHIARLERQLGVTLIDRSAGRLTEEGEVVVSRARRIHSELEALVADVNALRDEVVGEVRVGVIGTVARWLVPSLHQRMSLRHPGVHIVVVDASTTSLAPQLLAGSLSLAIVNLPLNDPDMSVTALFEEEILAVIPEGHVWWDRTELDAVELDRVPVILAPRGTAYRTELDLAAEAVGITLTPLAEIDGVRLITSLAFDGVGVAIVPSTAVPPHLAGPWKAIPVSRIPPRQVGVVQRRRGMLPAPARALLSVLQEVLPGEASRQRGVTLTGPVEVPAVDVPTI